MHDMDLYSQILCLMNILEASKIQPYDRYKELVGPKAKSKHVQNEVDHGAVGGPNLARVGYFYVHMCSRSPCCVLLALSWNTNENPSTDKLSRAIN